METTSIFQVLRRAFGDAPFENCQMITIDHHKSIRAREACRIFCQYDFFPKHFSGNLATDVKTGFAFRNEELNGHRKLNIPTSLGKIFHWDNTRSLREWRDVLRQPDYEYLWDSN